MNKHHVPTYHPVYRRPSDAWYPGNRAADLLIHLNHIWGDMLKLNEIRLQHREDEVVHRLLFKYILLEFRSLLDPLKDLQAIVMKTEPLIKSRPAPTRYVTKVQRERCRKAFKDFWQGMKQIEPDIYKIRNDIGAHRGLQSWRHVEELWEKIDPDRFVQIMNLFLPIWVAIKNLNIYEWSRQLGEQRFAIFGGALFHDWEDAYEENEVQQLAPADR